MKSISVNNKSFTLINLLGKGKGGYSYLVTDREREYVVKQIHHEPCDYYKFNDKLESELQKPYQLVLLDFLRRRRGCFHTYLRSVCNHAEILC